jgi:hypothetical protein
VNYEHNNRRSYLFQVQRNPNGRCLVISWAVTKITGININCIQPFDDEHTSFYIKNVNSDAQTLEMIYNNTFPWLLERQNIYNKQI